MKILFHTRLLLALTVASAYSSSNSEEDRKGSAAATIDRMIPEYPSATELLNLVSTSKVSSEMLVQEAVKRAKDQASLHAFITLDEEGALEAAAAAARVKRDGGTTTALQGLPIVIKDNIHVAGLPNTAGTPALAHFVPAVDNAVVATLKRAGAIVLGKTNLHELAWGITSDNVHFGAVRNPYNVSLFAGGSSGGTAAAIAAGIVAAGLGTDTGGSVRIPAALTGIVGFRPTAKRYDNSTAVTPISRTRDTMGVLARTVADVQLLDEIIMSGATGEEENNTCAANEHSNAPIRLGVPRDFYFDNVDKETAKVVEAALAKLTAAPDFELVEVNPPPNLADLLESGVAIAVYETVRDLSNYLREYVPKVTLASLVASIASPDVKELLAPLLTDEGKIPQSVYEEALNVRKELQSVLATYFADHHLHGMIFPTTPLPSQPLDDNGRAGDFVQLNGENVPTFATYIRNTDAASVAGLPGISLPAGLTATSHLPVGIEIDGPAWSDSQLLTIASRVEEVIGFASQPERKATSPTCNG